jgi:hypothetical protein
MNHDGDDFDCCSRTFDRTWRADQADKIKLRALEQAHAAKMLRIQRLAEAAWILNSIPGHEMAAGELYNLLSKEFDNPTITR